MHKTHFDKRRPLLPPAGMAGHLLGGEIKEERHRILLDDREVMRLIDTDTTPIPAPEDREGYYDGRHIEYWLSGQCDWRKMQPHMRARSGARYMDVGGSTGRVVRHAVRDDRIECWLSDININWIDWVDRHFTYPVKSYQSRIYPIIPAPDDYFDLISAFSVFTHLDCDAKQWLLEMRRVLKTGGRLYVTVNDEHVWGLLNDPNWQWLRDSISRGNRSEEFSRLVTAPLPDEQFVWEYSTAEAYNINTFFHSDYVKRVWGRLLDIAEYTPSRHGYQSVVVLSK